MKLIVNIFLILTVVLSLNTCNSGSVASRNPEPAPLGLGTFIWSESNMYINNESSEIVNLNYVGGTSKSFSFNISVHASESNIALISPTDCQITPMGCVFSIKALSIGQSIISINSLVPYVTSMNVNVIGESNP